MLSPTRKMSSIHIHIIFKESTIIDERPNALTMQMLISYTKDSSNHRRMQIDGDLHN